MDTEEDVLSLKHHSCLHRTAGPTEAQASEPTVCHAAPATDSPNSRTSLIQAQPHLSSHQTESSRGDSDGSAGMHWHHMRSWEGSDLPHIGHIQQRCSRWFEWTITRISAKPDHCISALTCWHQSNAGLDPPWAHANQCTAFLHKPRRSFHQSTRLNITISIPIISLPAACVQLDKPRHRA